MSTQATEQSPAADAVGEPPAGPVRSQLLECTVASPAFKYRISDLEQLRKMAQKWANRMLCRQRWARTTVADTYGDEAQSDLRRLFGADLHTQLMGDIADAGLIEITWGGLSDVLPEGGLLDMPWEAVLSLASAPVRRHRRLTVIRHAHFSPTRRAQIDDTIPEDLVFVEFAPDPIQQMYDFSSERIFGALALSSYNSFEITNPTLETLRSRLETRPPAIIHVSGADVSQARHDGQRIREFRDFKFPDNLRGTLIKKGSVTDKSDAYCPSASDIAKSLVPRDDRPPELVCCNLFHSAKDLAPLLLARGAHHVIALHDELDDAMAEIFFGEFYRAWNLNEKRIHDAFVHAWLHTEETRASRLYGSGIVLWSRHPCLEDAQETDLRRLARIATHHRGNSLSHSAACEPPDAEVKIVFDVDPFPIVNCAGLHARRSPFQRLRVLAPGLRVPVELELEVSLGADDACVFVHRQIMSTALVDLTDQVVLSITSLHVRSTLRTEALRTLLRVRVRAGAHVYDRSHPVTIPPMNEWEFSGQLTADLLPSFVLRNDPEVHRIVSHGTTLLRTLADDPSAGFSGHTSREGMDERDWTMKQVRALWYALGGARPMSYIAPAPGATLERQRLRTPSEILAHGHGTCIDLALLMAACIEYVGLKPVLVVYSDHASVGFWSSDDAYLAYLKGSDDMSSPQPRAWVVEGLALSHLAKYVKSRELVLLEMTLLPNQHSFESQIEDQESATSAGAKCYLDHLMPSGGVTRVVESVLDVFRARQSDIDPLPLAV